MINRIAQVACKEGNLDVIEFLVEKKALMPYNLNELIAIAFKNGCNEIAEYLVASEDSIKLGAIDPENTFATPMGYGGYSPMLPSFGMAPSFSQGCMQPSPWGASPQPRQEPNQAIITTAFDGLLENIDSVIEDLTDEKEDIQKTEDWNAADLEVIESKINTFTECKKMIEDTFTSFTDHAAVLKTFKAW